MKTQEKTKTFIALTVTDMFNFLVGLFASIVMARLLTKADLGVYRETQFVFSFLAAFFRFGAAFFTAGAAAGFGAAGGGGGGVYGGGAHGCGAGGCGGIDDGGSQPPIPVMSSNIVRIPPSC
jgi:hypothetical protein